MKIKLPSGEEGRAFRWNGGDVERSCQAAGMPIPRYHFRGPQLWIVLQTGHKTKVMEGEYVCVDARNVFSVVAEKPEDWPEPKPAS